MKKGSDCLLKIHAKVQVFLFIGSFRLHFFSVVFFLFLFLWLGLVFLFLKHRHIQMQNHRERSTFHIFFKMGNYYCNIHIPFDVKNTFKCLKDKQIFYKEITKVNMHRMKTSLLNTCKMKQYSFHAIHKVTQGILFIQ